MTMILLSDPDSAIPTLGYGHGTHGDFAYDPSDWFGPGVHIDITDSVTIEPNVIISHNSEIIRHEHDFGKDRTLLGSHSPLVIREGAYIGCRVVIVEGCREIGAWSVIGAGSVVTKDVPAYAVVAGNPARQIGTVKI